MNRGNAYDEKGSLAVAIADYDRALGIDPNYADAYFNRGVALRRHKRIVEAKSDFQEACRLGSSLACSALEQSGEW